MTVGVEPTGSSLFFDGSRLLSNDESGLRVRLSLVPFEEHFTLMVESDFYIGAM